MEELIKWYRRPWEKFAVYEGRARRKEYWTFVLGNIAILIVLGTIEGMVLGTAYLSLLFQLAILVPTIMLCIRRVHDLGKPGWWAAIGLVIGIIMLIFACMDGQPGANEYGPDPKEGAA